MNIIPLLRAAPEPLRLRHGEARRRRPAGWPSGIALAAALIASLPGVAGAKNRALIIGVSDYENLPEARQLRGPYNDARRVRETLLRRGFRGEDIALLANCPRGGAADCEERFPEPTLAGIRVAFDQVARQASAGDFVYLHFAGHGSQQPAPAAARADEPDDGLDEIFLPSDVGPWDGGIGAVANALTDNEINAFVIRVRNAGAFVWAVFDTCHSGTLVRSAQPDLERDRSLDPVADLGMPAEFARALAAIWPSDRAPPIEQSSVELRADAAGFVALYASQPDERTPELALPGGQSPRQVHGLFTFTLMQTLDAYPQLTYRQAVEQVMSRYEALNRSRPVPMYEGTEPDSLVFGRVPAQRPAQWPLIRRGGELVFAAGTLHEIAPGTTLLVVPDPGAPDGAALGLVEVARAGLHESTVQPVADAGLPALRAEAIPPTALVRLHQQAMRLRLRVAAPDERELAGTAWRPLARAIADLRRDGNLLVEWVEAGQPADVHLHAEKGRLLLLPSSADINAQSAAMLPSIAVAADASDAALRRDIASSLQAMARVINLLRVAQDSQLSHELIDTRFLAQQADGSRPTPVPAVPRRRLRPGDKVSLQIQSKAEVPLDVTVLFVDGRFGIHQLFPTERQPDNRLEPGASRPLHAKVTADPPGLERLIVIAAEARGATRTDFGFLAQDPLSAGLAMEKRAALGPLEKLLAVAGVYGGTTRGLAPADASRVAVNVLTWRTEP